MGTRFWWVTVAAVLGVAVTASLGRWQLSRAAQKEALQSAIDARAREPLLDATGGDAATVTAHEASTALLHRRVLVRGVWLTDYTVWLDNRQMQGRPGFYVVTPLRLSTGGVLLVQRGWAPRSFEDRTRLPELNTPTGLVEVRGVLSPPPARLYELGGAEHGPIRQNLDLDAFRAETGLPLAGLSIQQSKAESDSAQVDGLLRDWPQPDSGVDRHYGYAFQWFGLCALMVFLYAWFQIFPRFFPRLRFGGRGRADDAL
ncbi:SURF1 family protein [Hylemonella gracilis]|uniref:SURF1 family protein n=1 Tax=Hylemonella gracilis TaxID=80880 RepID=UPI001F612545|nr:SURF1 family protein [Hylemonella gracilis]